MDRCTQTVKDTTNLTEVAKVARHVMPNSGIIAWLFGYEDTFNHDRKYIVSSNNDASFGSVQHMRM